MFILVQGKINAGFEDLRRANFGENVILTCAAFGNPQPDVTWLYENDANFSSNVIQSEKEIVQSPCCDVTRTLHFTGLTSENNGTYTCQVTVDGNVTDSKDVDLFVIGKGELFCSHIMFIHMLLDTYYGTWM